MLFISGNMLCLSVSLYSCLTIQTHRRDYKIQERLIVSNSVSVQPQKPNTHNFVKSTERCALMSTIPMTDQIHRPKPAVLPVLRARCRQRWRLARETSCWGSLRLGAFTAKTPREPPVQVSAADSWGFPDIDLFLSVCCRPPTPCCVTDALSNTDAAGYTWFTPTHACRTWPHTHFTVTVMETLWNWAPHSLCRLAVFLEILSFFTQMNIFSKCHLF